MEVPLRDDKDPTKKVWGKVPFLDPHELLNYLVSSGRVIVNEEHVRPAWWCSDMSC